MQGGLELGVESTGEGQPDEVPLQQAQKVRQCAVNKMPQGHCKELDLSKLLPSNIL